MLEFGGIENWMYFYRGEFMFHKLPDGFTAIEKQGELVKAKKIEWEVGVLTTSDLIALTRCWDIVNVYKWVDGRIHVVLRKKER